MGAIARVWRPLLAGLLAVHGLIHVMGFAATGHIGSLSAISSTPSIGGAAASSVSMLLGVAWLAAALIFVVVAFGLVTRRTWWEGLVAEAAVLSLALCVLWWKDAPFGIVIDVLLMLGLIVAHWLPTGQPSGRPAQVR